MRHISGIVRLILLVAGFVVFVVLTSKAPDRLTASETDKPYRLPGSEQTVAVTNTQLADEAPPPQLEQATPVQTPVAEPTLPAEPTASTRSTPKVTTGPPRQFVNPPRHTQQHGHSPSSHQSYSTTDDSEGRTRLTMLPSLLR